MRIFMKKILLTILSLTLAFSLASCKKTKDGAEGGNDNNEPLTQTPAPVTYFTEQGLELAKTPDERYYTVVGIGRYTATDLVIPNDYNGVAIKEISDSAFLGQAQIKTLTVSSGIEKIGSKAFCGCTSLESVTISKNLEKIGSSAFENCIAVKTLVFGSGTKEIGKNAFLNCASIENLFYEGALKNFRDTTGITWCALKAQNQYYYTQSYPSGAGFFWYWSENGEPLVWEDYIGNEGLKFALSDDGLYYKVTSNSDMSDKKVVIPKAHKGLPVKEIDAMAFVNSSVQEIVIPETVTKISAAAFRWCSNLKSLTLPDSVEYVGESAFAGCRDLETVTLSKSLTEIGKDAFANCLKLEQILLPANIKKIGDGAFSDCKSSFVIYYESDAESFAKISVTSEVISNDKLYFYSENTPEEEGNFWYYGSENEITVW